MQYCFDGIIFIALSDPADSGLDGTLSMCVLPDTEPWIHTSILSQLESKYNLPTIYMSFYFPQNIVGYAGLLEFADDTDRLDTMTFGGSIVV